MESSHKYTVAGHTFVITLPEGFRQETYLSPYSPFASEESSDEPLITLHVALANNLKNVAKGKVKEIFNDEAPYFWLFEEAEGEFYTGHAPNYVKVYAKGENLHNEIRTVKLTEVYKDGMIGEIEGIMHNA